MTSSHTWSWNDFVTEAKQLVQWTEPGDWEWVQRNRAVTTNSLRAQSIPPSDEQNANGYLKSKAYYLQPSSIYSNGSIQSIEEHRNAQIKETDRVIEEDDASSAAPSSTKLLHVYHYHICHSSTFQVPLLAIDACELDGTPLEREQILLNFRDGIMLLDKQQSDATAINSSSNSRAIHRDVSEEANWQFLTQVDHPVLSRPIYALHPCKTSEWMATILSSSKSAPSLSGEEEIGDLDAELATMHVPPTLPMAQPDATSQQSTAIIANQSDEASSSSDSTTSGLPLLSWLSLLAPLVACPVNLTPALKQRLQPSKAVAPQR